MQIELRDVSLIYKERQTTALQNISLSVEPGTFVAIVGPSGCGKSTLLNLIAGFLFPTSGAVEVENQPIKGPSCDRVMIFQHSALFPFYTVVQNVKYGLQFSDIPREKHQKIAEEMLKELDLLSFASSFPRELSQGMMKLAEIGRALVLRPSVLLFDESLSNLDGLTRQQMQHRIEQIWRQHNSTVIWITHDLEEAVFLADRIVVLSPRPGRVLAITPVELPRPRPATLRTSTELQNIRAGILRLIMKQSETMSATGGTL